MKGNFQAMKILLIEDNLQNVEITRRALAKGKINNELYVARDGQEALDFLYRQGKFSSPAVAPRPAIILLDLNLPKVGGMEILKQIKNDPSLKSIPVIVLTVSTREEDIIQSYNLGVNTYIQKPVEFDAFVRVVKVIHEYWITIASLPPSSQ
jgi:CheY-like chemotaxis protein